MKKNIITIIISSLAISCLAQDTNKTDSRKGPVYMQSEEEEVFTIVEKMPQFPGGQENMYTFLKNNLQYPADAKQKNLEGTVYITFVIDKDGSLENIKVLRGVKNAPSLDEEAARVIGKMPKWIPGTQNDKPVRVQFNLPIKFSLGKSK